MAGWTANGIPRKRRQTIRSTGSAFADAVTALSDEQALTIRDASADEERWDTVGLDALGRLLVVVYAWRGETVRLISARKATPREREQYEEQHET
jgi:uncharacterized protein